MNKLDWGKFKKAHSEMQDCIALADIAELRDIDQSLDDLKSMVEDHVCALAGINGDY